MVSLLLSLVSLILAYLEPKSPRTLHSYDECPGPCLIQFFYSALGCSTYIFSTLASTLTFHRISMWQGRFSSLFSSVTSMGGKLPSRLFIGSLYYTFIYIPKYPCVQKCQMIFLLIYSQSKPCTYVCFLHVCSAEEKWQKWTFIEVCTAFVFLLLLPFYEYFYLVKKYSYLLIIIF